MHLYIYIYIYRDSYIVGCPPLMCAHIHEGSSDRVFALRELSHVSRENAKLAPVKGIRNVVRIVIAASSLLSSRARTAICHPLFAHPTPHIVSHQVYHIKQTHTHTRQSTLSLTQQPRSGTACSIGFCAEAAPRTEGGRKLARRRKRGGCDDVIYSRDAKSDDQVV